MSEKSIFGVLLVKKLLFQSDIHELVLLSLVSYDKYLCIEKPKKRGTIIKAGAITGTNTVVFMGIATLF